jgi:hypothetical protein
VIALESAIDEVDRAGASDIVNGIAGVVRERALGEGAAAIEAWAPSGAISIGDEIAIAREYEPAIATVCAAALRYGRIADRESPS